MANDSNSQKKYLATAETATDKAQKYVRVLPNESEIEHIAKAVAMKNDLSKLSTEDQEKYRLFITAYYGLDLFSDAFVIADMKGTLKLQPQQSCWDQLRAKHKISFNVTQEGWIDGPNSTSLYVVHIHATHADGRSAEDIGVRAVGEKESPVEIANAMMAAHTKAKNRVTKRLAPLGFPGLADYSDDEDSGGKKRVEISSVTVQKTPAKSLPAEASDTKPPKSKTKSADAPAPAVTSPAVPSKAVPPKSLKGRVVAITYGDKKLSAAERPESWWLLAVGLIRLANLKFPASFDHDEPTMQEIKRNLDEIETSYSDLAAIVLFENAFTEWFEAGDKTLWTFEQVKEFLTATIAATRTSSAEDPQPAIETEAE